MGGQHPCQQPWTVCPPLPGAPPSQGLGRCPDLLRLSRAPSFGRVTAPPRPQPCLAGQGKTRGVSREALPAPPAYLTSCSSADAAWPGLGDTPRSPRCPPESRAGAAPAFGKRRSGLRPFRGWVARRGWLARGDHTGPHFAHPLKRQARIPILAGRHGEQPCGRGAAWSGHRLGRTPARAGPRRGRDPGAPHFHRPLPQSAPPWSSLLPGCAARLPGAPPHTHRGVCPSHGRLPSPLRVPSSLGHDGRRLTPRPCPSPGFGWALPGAWSLLTGSRLLPGLLLRETGHTRSPWGGALPGCRGLPTQLTRVRPVGALASPGVRGALLRDPLLKRPGGPLV